MSFRFKTLGVLLVAAGALLGGVDAGEEFKKVRSSIVLMRTVLNSSYVRPRFLAWLIPS